MTDDDKNDPPQHYRVLPSGDQGDIDARYYVDVTQPNPTFATRDEAVAAARAHRDAVLATADQDVAPRDESAAENALNAIAEMCGCAKWDYPGQVVRDVAALCDLNMVLRDQLAATKAVISASARDDKVGRLAGAARIIEQQRVAALALEDQLAAEREELESAGQDVVALRAELREVRDSLAYQVGRGDAEAAGGRHAREQLAAVKLSNENLRAALDRAEAQELRDRELNLRIGRELANTREQLADLTKAAQDLLAKETT